MPNWKFRDIHEMFEILPREELEITIALRETIKECLPGVREKLSYNVPFYYRNKGICFLWPASVYWGNKKTNEGVRLGFQQGFQIPDETGFLLKGERKQVYWAEFKSLSEIDFDMVKAFLFEAEKIDKNHKNKNIKIK